MRDSRPDRDHSADALTPRPARAGGPSDAARSEAVSRSQAPRHPGEGSPSRREPGRGNESHHREKEWAPEPLCPDEVTSELRPVAGPGRKLPRVHPGGGQGLDTHDERNALCRAFQNKLEPADRLWQSRESRQGPAAPVCPFSPALLFEEMKRKVPVPERAKCDESEDRPSRREAPRGC